MPRTSIKRQEMARKKPYFAASIAGVVLIMAVLGYAESRIAAIHQQAVQAINQKKDPIDKLDKDLTKALGERDALKKQAASLAEQAQYRAYWADLFLGLKKILVEAEARQKESLSAGGATNYDVGIWIEGFSPVYPAPDYTVSGQTSVGLGTLNTASVGGAGVAAAQPVSTEHKRTGAAAATTPGTNEIWQIGMQLRAIDRDKVDPNASVALAYSVQEAITNSGYFVESKFLGDSQIQKNEQNGTFSFVLSLTLKRPFKL
jgi:hypothetical protein